jgi:hypothetical protein
VSFIRNKNIKAEHWLTYIKQNAKHSHSVESNTTENSKIMNNRFRRDSSILQGLNAVAQTVFLHRAPELQKQWIRRRTKKPKELSIRKTGRLNNSLPLLAIYWSQMVPPKRTCTRGRRHTVAPRFKPEAWWAKLDLDDFVASQQSKERFNRWFWKRSTVRRQPTIMFKK